MATRVVPTTRRGYHTYSVEGAPYCPNCCAPIAAGYKSCSECGIRRYRVAHEQDEGADFTICDPLCQKGA